MQEELARHRFVKLLMPAGEFLQQNDEKAIALVVSQPRKTRSDPTQKQVRLQRRQQKEKLFQMVKSLRAQGLKVNDIIRQTGI